MEDGIELRNIVSVNDDSLLPCFAAFECNVPFVLCFMVDRDSLGTGWLTLPATCMRFVNPERKRLIHQNINVNKPCWCPFANKLNLCF